METATAERTWPAETRRRSPGRTAGAWFAGLLLAGVSVVAGCRAADADGITPVPQLLAFLPWLIAPAAFALLLALLARWRTGMVWSVLALAALAWFAEPYGRSDEPTGAPLAEFRVLTSNVEFGRGTASLVPAIHRERPDVVFVEECEHHCSATLEQTFGGTGGTYPYRQAVEGASSDGSVILSRFPLTAAPGVPGTMGMPGAVADVHGHAVRLQLAHPMPPLPGQLSLWRRELGALRAYAASGGGAPTILAGDFNASQDHAAFRRILDTGLRDSAGLADDARTPSWPARTAPPFGTQIDHVLVSRDFSANSAHFLHIADSDHRALIVDITLHQPAQEQTSQRSPS
ncbi:endonuclease/exonuclease/phosphatase family protein [Streptomyces yaanensis]|uniref:Endonuclease/exonuclease/phosphatase family protein n=1 Tax=Streptomyces yaanensis TaxID=1142239 RepID=A0ABV7S9P0_9ACTN|nr:endonuclease/exonuclease/phosphatase family protein [Streptomyces sp. CGMCC 4.7035]WNB96664.1 endonuclease/exonuclease/phosphatase family protein [Streptomyces sp. CGMCC 4.7035]